MAAWPRSAARYEGLACRVLESLASQAMPALFAIFLLFFAYDVSYNRLGSSNGKFISFVDTCLNVFSYRAGCTTRERTRVGVRQGLQILASSFVIKFASGVAVSLLLSVVPVVFTGWRHSISFFVGFAMLWLTPGDLVFNSMQRSRAVRVFLGMGGGLYKMRKAMFAVEAAANSGGGWGSALLVAVVAVDGNTLTRRGVLWLESHLGSLRWDSKSSRRRPQHKQGGPVTLSMLAHHASRGAQQAILGSVLPLGLITACIWAASQGAGAAGEDADCVNMQYVDPAWAGGITDDALLSLRAALLAIFIWRAGTFHELEKIHTESLMLAGVLQKADKRE